MPGTAEFYCRLQAALRSSEPALPTGQETFITATTLQPHLLPLAPRVQNFYGNHQKTNFTFKGVCPSPLPATQLFTAFRPFPAMSLQSIAISSLCGPPATRVNHTVTSSRAAEHGYKAALPWEDSLTQLSTRPATAWALRGPAFRRAIQRGQPLPAPPPHRTERGA